MSYYRLYFRGSNARGAISGVEEIHAEDDVSAHREAEKRAGPEYMELWCGARRIASFEQHHRASRARMIPAE
jgi:hypothetical protein